MVTYISEKLQTPVRGEYDAIVVGAGPAGCGAAIACGRSGLKTLLIEKFNCLGGAWTTGFMNPFFDHANKDGVVEELVAELKSRGHFGGFANISFNYEYMKHILENKMRDAGVEVLYNTTFSRALTEGKTITGIVAENIEGRFAAMAKVVFDCTGDGNVAASAGCPFELGENGDYTQCQAMTLMFLVGNIPEKFRAGLMINEHLQRVYDIAGLEIPFKRPFLIPVPNSHFGVVQFTHVYAHDPLNAAALTAATVEARRQIIEAFELLTGHDPDFAQLELISSASVLGVRESRRVIGEYTLTLDDILSGAQFEDAVANVTFNVDQHTKSNNSQRYFDVAPYQIPLRAMLPKGYQGIAVAGRCISGDRDAMSSYRVTGNCCQMGEYAGYAVAQAIKTGMDIRQIKTRLTAGEKAAKKLPMP